MKLILYLGLLASSTLAERTLSDLEDRKPPKEPPVPTLLPVNWNDTIIDFSWCRQWNSSHTCGTQQLKHGVCCKSILATYAHDTDRYLAKDKLSDLDLYADDNLEEVSAVRGNCVLWRLVTSRCCTLTKKITAVRLIRAGRGKKCTGGTHTRMFQGEHFFTDKLCRAYRWSEEASSVKCCGGDPSAKYCAEPNDAPKCHKVRALKNGEE